MSFANQPLMDRLKTAGQEHLLSFYDQLDQSSRANLERQLAQIDDLDGTVKSVKDAIELAKKNAVAKDIQPLPQSSYAAISETNPDLLAKWYQTGLEAIAHNEVGVILMAGGQGTRLGSSSPKGCYDVELPSGKSLFQLQAERLYKIQKVAGEKYGTNPVIPWYIMTSGPTREPTEQFFISNKYFGLQKDQITFFNQGTMPCFDLEANKILLNSTDSISESPDGNGGMYKALYKNGILDDFSKRSLKHIHMYCVDNLLVKVADPVFIGYSKLKNLDLGTKVVRKRDAGEKVGLIVLDGSINRPRVIEYSEISPELREKKDSQDELKLSLRAANIVNHYYSVDLLKREIPKWISSSEFLPYHIAQKKIPTIDSKGIPIKPEEPNGIKLEQFIFDVFPAIELSKFGCLEVERSEEFSPLKNARGSPNDTPDTCRAHLLELGAKWVKENGGSAEEVEVSPLTSYGGEGLEFVKGKSYKNGEII